MEAETLNITLVNRSAHSPHIIDFVRLAPGHEDATKREAKAAADKQDFCAQGC